MIRKGFLIAALLLAGLLNAHARTLDRPWSEVLMPPTERLMDVASLGRYHFWAVGVAGTLLETNDGGRVWSRIDAGVGEATLHAVTADVALNMVVAVGDSGWVVRGYVGHAPKAMRLRSDWTLTSVGISNSIIVIAGTDEHQRPLILRSADGGQTFIRMATTVNVPAEVNGIQFMGSTTAVVFGATHRQEGVASPMVLISRDAAMTWEESLSASIDFNVSSVAGTALQLIAMGVQLGDNQPGLFRSMDEGATWVFEEHSELGLVTDAIRADGPEVIAVGLRIMDAEPEPIVVASEFFSTDAGRNWGIRDIAETEGAVVRIARGGDRVIAVGLWQSSYRRFYDRLTAVDKITIQTKYLPLGTADIGSFVERNFESVLRNTSEQAMTISRVEMHGASGCVVQLPTAGTVLVPGAEIGVQVFNAPQTEGVSWGVLQIEFSDGTTAEMLVSSTGQAPAGNAGISLVEPVLDLGQVVQANEVIQAYDLVVNHASEDMVVERIELAGGDLVAFSLADLPEFPVTLATGETLPLTVVFDPLTPGFYHLLVEVVTGTGRLLQPIAATSRGDVFDHVIDLGETTIGHRVEQEVGFRHGTWNAPLELYTVDGPAAPFAVTSTTDLPFEAGPLDEFVVTLALEPQAAGHEASVIRVPWSYGPGYVMREDRRVVRGVVAGVTTVDAEERAVGSLEVAPHPVGDHTRITLPQGHAWNSLEIIDIHGRTVIRRTLDEDQAIVAVDLAHVAPGTYIVSAHHTAGVLTRPLVRF